MDLESVESVTKAQILDPEGLPDLFLVRIKTDGALILKLGAGSEKLRAKNRIKGLGF
jgi:hypothetical protein